MCHPEGQLLIELGHDPWDLASTLACSATPLSTVGQIPLLAELGSE